MKKTVKKLVMKAMRMPHIHHINKQGNPIVRKQELQHMICQAQKMIEHKNKPLGENSVSVTEKTDDNGNIYYTHSTGFYNVTIGKWVVEGLLTRNKEDGYKLTELGRLFASTDTRAYEIEKWKSKFKSELQRANRLNSQVNDLILEKRKLHDRIDEIYFGKDFMDSDDKGSLQEYFVTEECQSIVTSSPPNSVINTCLSNMQESLNCITEHINKE